MGKKSKTFHNFVELVGPRFKSLVDAAAREVARDEACEACEKAHEVALAEIEGRNYCLE